MKELKEELIYIKTGGYVKARGISVMDEVVIGVKGIGEAYIPFTAVDELRPIINAHLKGHTNSLKRILETAVKHSQYIDYEFIPKEQ